MNYPQKEQDKLFVFNQFVGNNQFIDNRIQNSSRIVDFCSIDLQNNMNNIDTQNKLKLKYEVRIVQALGNSLVITLPHDYTKTLDIEQGDIIKIDLSNDKRRLILQKVVLDFNEDELLREA